jgi:predicted nucleic acid-binding protein
MNASCFVDTNILIYVHDRTTGAKHDRARQIVRELWESRSGVISTQVLQEFCINARRRVQPPVAPEQLRLIIQTYLGWEVVVNTGKSVLQALELEARYKISFWDALILNAAEEAGCDLLYSEDLSAGQHYGSVLVVNPFQ